MFLYQRSLNTCLAFLDQSQGTRRTGKSHKVGCLENGDEASVTGPKTLTKLVTAGQTLPTKRNACICVEHALGVV